MVSFNDLTNLLNLKEDIEEKIKKLKKKIEKFEKEKKKLFRKLDGYSFTILNKQNPRNDFFIEFTYDKDFKPIVKIYQAHDGYYPTDPNGRRKLYLTELEQLQKYIECAVKIVKYNNIIEKFNKVCYEMERVKNYEM